MSPSEALLCFWPTNLLIFYHQIESTITERCNLYSRSVLVKLKRDLLIEFACIYVLTF